MTVKGVFSEDAESDDRLGGNVKPTTKLLGGKEDIML